MEKALSIFWRGEENMNTCFQSLFSLPIRLLELWDLKLKLNFFLLGGI
jgi:hypothetical protein